MARILFIHRFDYYEPLGLMFLSSFLKKNGHSCELIDLRFEKKYLRKIQRIQPDILAYTVTTNVWKYYQEINVRIRQHVNALSVFGGPHCTFFPGFIAEKNVDVICRGEGEWPLLELANSLDDGKIHTDIPNLWFKTSDGIAKNDVRPLVENLDIFPFPDRELVNIYNHYRKRSRARTITSRGCPYNCSYCYNHSLKEIYRGKGKYLRRRSPQNVIEEVKQLKAMYRPANLEFHDDVFILDKQWVEEFLALYRDENINIPFEANMRVELVTPEMVDLLKKSGCYCVQFGIESGDERFRREILNRPISDDQLVSVAGLFRQAGIKMNIFNMVGLPGETVSDCFETIRLNQKCRPDYAMNTIFHPYPQTRLAEISVEKGFFDGCFDNYNKSIFYGGSVIRAKDIKQILRLHYLFAFAVRFPVLIALIRLLIRLPLSKIYQSWYFLYRVYVIMFVFKRLHFREIFLRK